MHKRTVKILEAVDSPGTQPSKFFGNKDESWSADTRVIILHPSFLSVASQLSETPKINNFFWTLTWLGHVKYATYEPASMFVYN